MRVDLTQSHDVLGWYQQLHGDYADIRTKYKDAGTKYAFSVLDGDVLAGYMIKLAAFRHIQDLVRSETDDSFDYHYNVKKPTRYFDLRVYFLMLIPVNQCHLCRGKSLH